MYPFSYKSHITVAIEESITVDTKQILDAFKREFDDPQSKGKGVIAFTGFNTAVKRHGWMDNGELKVEVKDKTVSVDLLLNFYTFPIILLFVSVGLLWGANMSFALVGLSLFWGAYALVFLWTVVMYERNVRTIIRRRLYRVAEITDKPLVVIGDVCPACGHTITPQTTACPDCGLVLNNS